MKTFLIALFSVFILLTLSLWLFRMLAPSEVDDITPGIPCSAEQGLVMQSQTLWVIPDFRGVPISENKSWCKEILSLNKTLGLHGVKHTYNEFGTDRNQSYLENGVRIFEDCFGFRPTEFKAPQLNISESNAGLVSKNGMILRGLFNQLSHRVYHCNDSGKFSNEIVRVF